MNYKYVEVVTNDNIKLPGMMIDNRNDKCILFIPGFTGNFFDNGFMRFIGEKLNKNGYDFLFSHNRGSFQMHEFEYLRDDGKWKKKTIGAAFENFGDSISDIAAWVEYLKSVKKKEIVLIGHSRGCNKIVYYLSKYNPSLVKKVILLSPQDTSNFNELPFHVGMYEEAKDNIKNGENKKVLSRLFLDFCPISSETYLEMVDDELSNNLPYKLLKGNFKQFEKNKKRTIVVIGTKDGGENSEKYMKEICKHSSNCEYKIVDQADHVYSNKEEELYNILLEFLNE